MPPESFFKGILGTGLNGWFIRLVYTVGLNGLSRL